MILTTKINTSGHVKIVLKNMRGVTKSRKYKNKYDKNNENVSKKHRADIRDPLILYCFTERIKMF